MASKNVLALAERLKNEFGLNVDVDGYMSNRNKASIQAGGFVWEFWNNNGQIIGGYEPMAKYLVKRNKLEMTTSNMTIEIYAYSKGEIGFE